MTQELIDFVLVHEHDDIHKLLLKEKIMFGYPASFVADQIMGRRRVKEKLPTWYAQRGILFPPNKNLEQSSSEATAKLKCELIRASNPDRPFGAMADLSAGFGVDSFFFSTLFSKVYHVEPDRDLCRLAKQNHTLLGVKNIETIESTAEEFLDQSYSMLEWFYIDPSRKKSGNKIITMQDSQPDVTKLLPQLFLKANNILIKTSPLLDLKEGWRQLPGTKEIYVVSVGNECKEVLFRLEKKFKGEPSIHAINLINEGMDSFQFLFSEEANAEPDFNQPLDFIYEPNASILKSGAFKSVAKAFGLFKISVNTHLYTSSLLNLEFPGRIFRLRAPFSSLLESGKFNVVSRNYPLTPEQIKKKFKLKDGGERYLLAFSGMQQKYLFEAERVK